MLSQVHLWLRLHSLGPRHEQAQGLEVVVGLFDEVKPLSSVPKTLCTSTSRLRTCTGPQAINRYGEAAYDTI